METTELHKEICLVKDAIKKVLMDFNERSGIDIAEIMAKPLVESRSLDGVDRVKDYDILVGIDL